MPSKSASRPGKLISSDPKQAGFIDLIKNVLRLDTTKSVLTAEDAAISSTTTVKAPNHSILNPDENTHLIHRQTEQNNANKIDLANPQPKKSATSGSKNFSQAGPIRAVPPSPVDGTTPSIHTEAEKKSNPYQETSLIPRSNAPPALREGTSRLPSKTAMLQPKGEAAAIRSNFTRNKRAAIAALQAQKPGAHKRPIRHGTNADTSGPARKNLPIFRIGKSLTLGRLLNPKALASRQCFQKERGTGWFCLEQADWPQQMARKIGKSTPSSPEPGTIAKYKNGRAVRIYSAIPSDTYEDAVKYYSDLIGPATRVSWDKLARLGNTPLSNPSSIWVNTSSKGGTEILEIRRFDNIRGLMASETRGLVRLFKENSDPIFSVLSDADIILHQLRAQKMQ